MDYIYKNNMVWSIDAEGRPMCCKFANLKQVSIPISSCVNLIWMFDFIIFLFLFILIYVKGSRYSCYQINYLC